jgi:hypothetical protein
VAGRPESFSDLVGSYQITASASPTAVRALDPLILTVTIAETSGQAPPAYLPRRERLRIFPKVAERDFYVQDLPERDRHLADQRIWEFVYGLKPKDPGVTKVPALKLSYFDPRVNKYQVAYSRSIALQVKPRPEAEPPAEALRVVPAPERMYALTTGPEALQPASRAWWASPVVLAVLLLVPPAGCWVWYAVWRRLHPDAAVLARLHRSRAAQHALGRLQGLGKEGAVAGGSAIVADYLRQRLDLPSAEPTPAEALAHLRRAHVSARAAARVAEFLRACDAGRFAPRPPVEGPQILADAENLILTLEAEPCLSRHS